MKNLQVKIKTDLSTEPVTSSEAKLWCKVTGTTEDSIFTILISAARRALEKYTSSSFGEKTIHATWVKMPDYNEIELPYGPVISVDHVFRIDEEGSEEELVLNQDFWVFGSEDALLRFETFWSTGIRSERSVRVEYTAGYGHANTEALPTDLKLAILKQIATDYEFREDIGTGSMLTNESKKLAAPYRKKLWF
jgi:uncharacterized phiE125 gp8 family phage protein